MGKGGSPKSQTQTTKHELTPQAQELWRMAKPTVTGIFDKPYQPYGGNRVAGLNGLHQSAFGLAGSPSGMPIDAASSRGFLNKTLTDNGLGTPVPQNPYIGTRVASNPMLEANNPYFEGALRNTLNDVTDQFQRNRIAQTDANMARHNLFGGSNWTDAQRLNQRELASTLGNISTNARLQEYNNRAQLHESDIGRRLQEQGRDAALAQQQIGMSNQNANLHRAQQMQAASLLPNIAQMETADTANRYNLQATAGNALKKQEQAVLDDTYQRFAEQQNYDKQRSDYLREWLAAINGNGVSTVTGPGQAGPNGAAKLLGSGLLGLGAYSMMAPIGATAAGGAATGGAAAGATGAAAAVSPWALPVGLLAGSLGLFS